MCSLDFNGRVFYAIFFTLTYAALFVAAFTPSRNNVVSVSSVTPATASNNIYKTGIPNHQSAGKLPTTALPEDGAASHEEDEEEEDGGEEAGDSNDAEEDKNCTCSGSNCLCCINLNLSFIDLGGPGCVKFGYVADNDSLTVNMSYGGRLLESDTLKRTSNEPTCMDLLSDLAQMCAKFTGLTRVAKGVKGCVSVEPLLLGVSQTSYDVGCFNMDIEGVQPQPQPQVTVRPLTNSNGTKETTDTNEEEELAAAISQSAAEGINWFNDFIASVFSEEANETLTDSVQTQNNRTYSNNVKLS